jgi:hypothetical protein
LVRHLSQPQGFESRMANTQYTSTDETSTMENRMLKRLFDYDASKSQQKKMKLTHAHGSYFFESETDDANSAQDDRGEGPQRVNYAQHQSSAQTSRSHTAPDRVFARHTSGFNENLLNNDDRHSQEDKDFFQESKEAMQMMSNRNDTSHSNFRNRNGDQSGDDDHFIGPMPAKQPATSKSAASSTSSETLPFVEVSSDFLHTFRLESEERVRRNQPIPIDIFYALSHVITGKTVVACFFCYNTELCMFGTDRSPNADSALLKSHQLKLLSLLSKTQNASKLLKSLPADQLEDTHYFIQQFHQLADALSSENDSFYPQTEQQLEQERIRRYWQALKVISDSLLSKAQKGATTNNALHQAVRNDVKKLIKDKSLVQLTEIEENVMQVCPSHTSGTLNSFMWRSHVLDS